MAQIYMYTVYVLKSEVAEKSYVGFTNNLERRIEEHNLGKSGYTSKHKPWKVIYTEEFPSINEAVEREKYLKSRSGRRYLKKVFTNLSRPSH